jgi:signal peptidase I
MTIQTINIGNQVNDGLGDDLRTAFQKVNANFATLDAETTVTGLNVGTTGVGLFKQRSGANLEFKKLVPGDNILITDVPNGVEINNTLPDPFFRFETDSGNIVAGIGNTGAITVAGTVAPGAVTGRKDIEVTTSGSYLYIKNLIPVVDILTTYDFGYITGEYTNAIQLALASANIDFGTVTLPGRLYIDCGVLS